MRISNRQTQIMEFLSSRGGTLSSSELTESFDVSVQTIRKDLNELSDLGFVRRVHGGITLPTQSRNLSFTNRQVINLEEKNTLPGLPQHIYRMVRVCFWVLVLHPDKSQGTWSITVISESLPII